MARIFAETHRPTTPIIMFWGDAFPGFLEQFPPLQAYPYMPDVARIEVARGIAYHAEDALPLDSGALQAIAAKGGDTALTLHKSVQMIRSKHPIVTIWQSNQPSQAPASKLPPQGEIALIMRDRALDVPVQAIANGDAAMLELLLRGQTLLHAASEAARSEPGHTPDRLLGILFRAGALVSPMSQ
jgi:hypothetical protein